MQFAGACSRRHRCIDLLYNKLPHMLHICTCVIEGWVAMLRWCAVSREWRVLVAGGWCRRARSGCGGRGLGHRRVVAAQDLYKHCKQLFRPLAVFRRHLRDEARMLQNSVQLCKVDRVVLRAWWLLLRLLCLLLLLLLLKLHKLLFYPPAYCSCLFQVSLGLVRCLLEYPALLVATPDSTFEGYDLIL